MKLALVNAQYIVTANDDGSVPLNSKIVLEIEEHQEKPAQWLVQYVNGLDEILRHAREALIETADPEPDGTTEIVADIDKALRG